MYSTVRVNLSTAGDLDFNYIYILKMIISTGGMGPLVVVQRYTISFAEKTSCRS